MTTEESAELDRRFAAYEAKIHALVAQFTDPLIEANKIQAESEERQKRETELYNKRAAEHDAQAKAQHARHEEAITLQRRNVEAWERIAAALERMWPFPAAYSSSLQQTIGSCPHFQTEIRTDGRYCTTCGQRAV